MSSAEIDEYLRQIDDPKRATLEELRETLQSLLPEAEECIAYSMPAYRLRGKVIAGFAVFKTHLSYLPHSGSVFPQLADSLAGYSTTTGALRFAVDEPLPRALVAELVATRMAQAFPDSESTAHDGEK